MSQNQSEVPSTSNRVETYYEYYDLSLQAKEKYEVAQIRPQDADPGMLRFIRRTNLEMNVPLPMNYSDKVRSYIATLPILKFPNMLQFSDKMVMLQDAGEKDAEMVGLLKPLPNCITVLSVDLIVHNELSYDGFMCLGSVSSPYNTLVVDTLFNNRDYARSWMTKMLTGKRTLKVFLGVNNDVFRLRKEWNVFPYGVVDIHSMFLQWKESNIMDVYEQCLPTVKKQRFSRGKDDTDVACKLYLDQLCDPRLDFFVETLFADERIPKNPLASMADFRHRPVHKELVSHTAQKTFMTLKVFYDLYNRIGQDGLKHAVFATMQKLTEPATLPRYRWNLKGSPELQWTLEMIMRWRDYLGKNLDYRPEQILPNRHLTALARAFHGNEATTAQDMAELLREYEVPDKFYQSAKLLLAYLDRSGESLQKMRDVICRSCNQTGHVAKFCYMPKDSQLHKEFVNREENRGEKIRQYQRRREHYCQKRGYDAATYTCPWESAPGVPR